MGQLLLILAIALVVGVVVFGVAVLVTGSGGGLDPAEPDGAAVPLPTHRPLVERDMASTRFDTALRGYRMAQVDVALRRAAYDIGYKDELIGVLEAEVVALREGRSADADELRRTREAALRTAAVPVQVGAGAGELAAIEPDEPAVIDLDQPAVIDLDEPISAAGAEPGDDDTDTDTTPKSSTVDSVDGANGADGKKDGSKAGDRGR